MPDQNTSVAPGRSHTATPAADALADVVDRLCRDTATLAGHPSPLDEALDRLHVLAQIQTALEAQIRQAAQDAAEAGANYAQLGAAWNITRQGARQRWPGLVFARASATPDPGEGSAQMASAAPLLSYVVLLVEDDDADAMLIEEAMLERGMARRVQRAVDGIVALAHLRDGDNPRPDLIVLDLNMPRMNGHELLAVLKNDPVLSLIPVVVLTTSAAPDDITGAYKEHVNAYVTKPVNLDDFIDAVHSIDTFFLETVTRPARNR